MNAHLKNASRHMIAPLLMLSTSAQAATIDVMVLYTPEAETRASNIETKINQFIEESNAAYRDSGIDVSLRLVHSERIDIAGTDGVSGTGLDNLRRDQKVNTLRAQFGADAVALISRAVPNGNGLITCGIGYIGQGQNGQLASHVKSIAFSMSAVDCGASTFTHELGHNFGLGHSRKQGSVGGVFEHGVGYGVENGFTTIMAYDFLFNAVDVNKFSSPLLTCSGEACGIAAGSSQSADAVAALKPVVQQFADFFPSSTEPEPTDTQPEVVPDPVNPIPDEGFNLTDNAAFEQTVTPWIAPYGGNLQINSVFRNTGEASLSISQRNFYYSGPIQDMTAKMNAGEAYHFSASVRLKEGTDSFRFALGVDDANGLRFTSTPAAGVNAETWTKVEGDLTVNANGAIHQILILGYGPAAEKDFFMDDFRVESLAFPEPEPVEPEVVDVIKNGGFEPTAAFWEVGFGGKLFLSSAESNSGSHSLAAYNRRAWYHGPKQAIEIEHGNTYKLSLAARLHPKTASTDTLFAYLYFKDDRGDQWTRIVTAGVNNANWKTLTGAPVTVEAVGNITAASVFIMSANARTIFYVDDITFIQQ